MTVKLLADWKDPRSGKEYRALNLLTTDAATENGLVSAKHAETNLTGGTAWAPPTASDSIDRSEWLRETPITIASVGVPFIIPPGDGAAVGLQFTGTAGAFTLSAAILTNVWNALKGCWMYLPASFGGSTCPAGWYWAVFSSDTAGVVYTDTYVSGKPARPSSPVAFSINLTGRLTTTTAEVTGPTGFVLPGNSLGPNGCLKSHFRSSGNLTGTKTFKGYLGSSVFSSIAPTVNPTTEIITSFCNQGVANAQLVSGINSNTGVGVNSNVFTTSSYAVIDTTTDKNISYTLQLSVNTACAMLLHADVTVTYGE
ncbi:MAG: hypothetical protein IPK44_02675 [Candidatus Accumulibacter sp.]|uniref:hypothetical protein n=1 Tax=Accumulibacter sp. TaxID=2053492 RepID=UPI002582AF6B|nr:hypothetical protein [Accumulibacter sp.]MBK8113504.1 hypothetical protein [Accumulibacter sp.]